MLLPPRTLVASHTWHPSTPHSRTGERTASASGTLSKRLPALPSRTLHGQDLWQSPIRRMPLEIIQEIFEIFSIERHSQDLMDNLSSPVLLTHVCREWRAVAINTAYLWTSFRVQLPDSSLSWSQYSSALSVWLRRSGRHPLKTGCVVVKWDQEQRYMLAETLEALCSQSYRWEAFDFEAGSESLPLLFENLPFLSFSSRKFDLFLRVLDHSSSPSTMVGVNLPFLWLPRVRDLDIITLHSFTLPVNAPWQCLDTLRLETREGADVFHSVQSFVQILSQCEQLTHCFLTLSGMDALQGEDFLPIVNDLSGSIHLPALEHLGISVPHCPMAGIALLELFTVPALEHLIMHGPVDTTWDVGRRLIDRSKCNITDLYLDNLFLPTEEVGFLLYKLSPTLKCLEVRIPDNGDEWTSFAVMLEAMTLRINKPALCPLLTSICFTLEKQLMLNMPVLAFIASRTYLRPRSRDTDVVGLSYAILRVMGNEQDFRTVERMMSHERSLIEGKRGKCEVQLRKFDFEYDYN